MPPFATADELETFMQAAFTAEETAAAPLLLELATAAIKGAAGQHIELVTDDEIVLDGSGTNVLLLPETPVVAVSSIEVEGEALVVDDDFTWNRHGILSRWPRATWGLTRAGVAVTYTHGYPPDEVPGELKLVCLSVAARALENPTGVPRESIGSYGVSYPQASFNTGTQLQLTEAERRIVRRLVGA